MIDRDCLRLRFGVNEMEWMRVHNFWGINFLLRLSFELAKTFSTFFAPFYFLGLNNFLVSLALKKIIAVDHH